MFFFIFILFTSLHANEKKYHLSIVAMFQNEAPYLKEWIEYHKLLGVEHFYLFNNLSQDDFYPILQPYIDAGFVELEEWPFRIHGLLEFLRCQAAVYSRVIWKRETHWLAIIDIDEFIVPVRSHSLVDFLKNYEPYPAIAINWQVFGTSNIKKIPKDKLLIESLIWKADERYWMNRNSKSIVKPDCVLHMANSHACNLLPGYSYVNEKKVKIPYLIIHTPKISVDKIQVNHYWTRDEDFFWNKKLAQRCGKGSQGKEKTLTQKNSCHKVIDQRIFKYLKELKDVMNDSL